MAAITRAIHDPNGFPTPAFAAVKLVLFVLALTVLVLGLPVLAGAAIYGIAS